MGLNVYHANFPPMVLCWIEYGMSKLGPNIAVANILGLWSSDYSLCSYRLSRAQC